MGTDLELALGGVPPERPHDLAELHARDGAAAVAVKEGEHLAVLLKGYFLAI